MADTDQKQKDDVARRMNGALKRALATKPTPHKNPSPTPPKQRRGGLGEHQNEQG